MGVDTLKRIKKAEEDGAAKIRAAQAEAEKILARAAKASGSIIEGAGKESEEGAAALKAQKIAEGQAEAEKVMASAERELQKLRLNADRNMARAAGLVAKRVCG